MKINQLALSALLTLVTGSAYAQGIVNYNKTIVVLDTGVPATNGADLIAAVNVPLAPGPGDRWLVILEPGTYDIGTATLNLRNFVDVQGSGRNSSVIVGRGSTVVLAPVGIDAELRDLTVEVQPGSGITTQTGIQISTAEFKLTSVNVEGEAARNGTAIRIDAAGRPRLSAVFPRMAAPSTAIGMDVSGGEGVIVNEMFVFLFSFGRSNIGILTSSNTGEAVLEGVSGFVAGAQDNIGILARGATPVIRNNAWRVDGLGSASRATGLYAAGTVNVKDSQFAVGGASQTIAIRQQGGDLALQSVVAETFGSGVIIATLPIALQISSSGSAVVDQSVLQSATAVSTTSGTSLTVGATRLSGGRVLGGFSRCAQSYDGNFIDIPNGPC